MHRLLATALLLMLSAGVLHAEGLETYKGWDQTPQGFFMTKAERAEWATITTDEAAHQFVGKMLALRGPMFIAEITKRASNADKYLTVGTTKGSRSLRGKMSIVFGPPASMQGEKGTFTFTFSAKTAPALGSDYVVVLEVDPLTGIDRLQNPKAAAELEERIEAVNQSYIKFR